MVPSTPLRWYGDLPAAGLGYQTETGLPEWLDGDSASRRLVLVTVGRFDLRAMRPLEYSWRLPASDRRALHVATDERGLWALAEVWMAGELSYPLHTVEDGGGVAATIAKVVEYELDSGFDEVVVLVGRVALSRRRYRLLHDRSADEIGRVVATIPGALAAVMTVATV